jgi:drug/metabolite transporter (DMT)-like permease
MISLIAKKEKFSWFKLLGSCIGIGGAIFMLELEELSFDDDTVIVYTLFLLGL